MPPLDDNNARGLPVSRSIAQAVRDEFLYCAETAVNCPSPDDFVQHGSARHIRSARVARSAHRRVSPWTGTPPSLTSPSVPNRHSSSGYAQAAPAVRPDLMRRSLGRTGCTSCRDHAGDSAAPKRAASLHGQRTLLFPGERADAVDPGCDFRGGPCHVGAREFTVIDELLAAYIHRIDIHGTT